MCGIKEKPNINSLEQSFPHSGMQNIAVALKTFGRNCLMAEALNHHCKGSAHVDADS